MASPLEEIVRRLADLGFYDFLIPFIITSTIFYAILRKTKVLGESPIINGILSMSIAFLIFGFPVLTGLYLGIPIATYFTQITMFTLMFVMAMIVASIFYPDFTKFLIQQFTRRTMIWIAIGLAVALLATSGMFSTVFGVAGGGKGQDISLFVAGIVIFIILVMVAASTVRAD
jgi:hypothetical protein